MAQLPMNRGVLIWTFGGLAAAILGWLSLHEVDDSSPRSSAASPSASTVEADAPDASVPETDAGQEELAFDLDAGLSLAEGAAEMPALDDAPKSVTFGVVLIQYAGAQGAPADTRSKAAAKALADEVAVLAKDDFAAAVSKGDKGSVANAGKMYRGILEARPEYALFSLSKGEASGVVDTPRGFWIAKRID